MLSIQGFGWFSLVCFSNFGGTGGGRGVGAVFTVEYKSNVLRLKNKNILSDVL